MLALTLLMAMVSPLDVDLPEVRNFIQSIYAGERSVSGSTPDFLGKDGKAVFSSALFRLIRASVRHTPQGFAGRLDFDPLCACQDPEGLQLQSMNISAAGGHKVVATVTLHTPDSTDRMIRLFLTEENGAWRVNDVGSASVPSLQKFLEKGH